MRIPSLLLLLCAATACAQNPAPSTAPAASQSQNTAQSSTAARDSVGRPGMGALSTPNANPFPSTYTPFPSRTTLIRNATIMTAAGPTLQNASILLRDGKIVAVGSSVTAPSDAVVIDGTGKYVTPGIIDVHSHLGVYAAPGGGGLNDGNEATNPNTALEARRRDLACTASILIMF